MSKIDETSVGGAGVMGFQVPMGIKKRKKKVDEAIALNEDINHGLVLAYVSTLDEQTAEVPGKLLDEGNYTGFADMVKEHAVREMVRSKMKEVVRKKAGGGGYVLYSPNQGKKKASKAVGNFPTKLGAKKAELARFPPKDPGKLKRLRKEIDRLLKDPKKRAEKEKSASKEKGTDDGHKKASAPKHKEHKKEDLDLLRGAIRMLVQESLFREEKTDSDWDDIIGRLSKQAANGDKKLVNLQKGIQKKSEKVLRDALSAISKSVDRKKVKIKELGVRSTPDAKKTYLAFQAVIGQAEVGPIAIYIQGGVPKIELSDDAKVGLTKADPADSKLFRADLVQVQERVLDRMDDLERAVLSRDKYLEKLEDEVDGFVSDLTPLQVSLLKQLLVKKYRKV